MPSLHTCTAWIAVLALGTAASAQETPFPMDVVDAEGEHESLLLRPRYDELGTLGALPRVTMTDVPLPGGQLVDVFLDRVRLPLSSDLELTVDGVLVDREPAVADLTLWQGRVVGDPDSDVFLSLSSAGSRGWIRFDGDYLHLLAARGRQADWSEHEVRMVSETSLNAAGHRLGAFCRNDELREGPLGGTAVEHTDAGHATFELGGAPTMYSCNLAVETDWQYYNRFGNLGAAEAFMLSLVAASSVRFEAQAGMRWNLVYLGLYTSSNDPWSSPENGDVGDLLGEFRGAWANNQPGGAHLSHIVSGAHLGGGVAWVDTLCSNQWGFAASAGVTGATPFPVTQGPFTWDFVVFTHEAGHNVGTGHTHDSYCPPLDRCSSNNCQGGQQCSTSGTVMSYCHTCGSGMSNITTWFHDTVANHMRNDIENSCLPADCESVVDYCPALTNSTGSPADIYHFGTTSASGNDMVLNCGPIPPGNTGLFFYGPVSTWMPLGNGTLCVGNGATGVQRLQPTQADFFGFLQYPLDIEAPFIGPLQQITPGSTWYFQGWFRDPQAGGSGFNFSSAMEVLWCP